MKKYDKFVEEIDLKTKIKDSSQNNTEMNNTYLPLESKIEQNNLILIFRNQLSNDITISIDKSTIITISDLINLLLSKLKASKTESLIRLFFKGRPLKKEEKIEDISNL